MIDWLEIARRELSSDRGEVSEVFTVGGPKDPEKSGSPETSDEEFRTDDPVSEKHDLENSSMSKDETAKTAEKGVSAVFTVGRTRNPEKSGSREMSASRSPADDPSEKCDLENLSTLEEGTAKTAERGVSDVFAVGAPEGLGEFASGRKPVESAEAPPSGSQISEETFGEAPRKLRKPSDEAVRWCRRFEDQIIVVQCVRNLPQAEAERAAFDIVLVEFLNATHPDTDPLRCAWCGKPETAGAVLLPIGVGARHAWLHSGCWAPWREGRRKAAEKALAIMGIVEPAP